MVRLRTVLVVGFLFLGGSAAAAAQTPNATLPSKCSDQKVAPPSVILACGDAGAIAKQLTWTNWGQAQATATGVLSVNTCDPDCATGGRTDYSVSLVASELRVCGYGEPQYTLVTYSFPDASPYPPGSPGADDPTYRFPCPTRPHADPKITSMRMRLTGHNAPGKNYYVRVSVRLLVCEVRGRSAVVFNETLGLGKASVADRTHTEKFWQVRRCEYRTFKWKLHSEFSGVGTYKVAATVWDKDAQFSRTVARAVTTVD